MSLAILNLEVVNRFHYTGGSWMDGDLTLWETSVSDDTEQDQLFVVVPRGDAFIDRETVHRRLERFGSVRALRAAAARDTRPGKRPQIHLNIEPGEA